MLIRWAGLAAMAAGIYFAGIQPIHPPDAPSSVTPGTEYGCCETHTARRDPIQGPERERDWLR
jgi:hypothetical protein